eukprot:TRINITY_DN93733_c0_g1_i1.p1 TRINITY_DN93733_c0_g1~~TRINITY_DN93733_c0_g1_i1.p1  ORF type:complete len:558 (+),score=100.81 TRINITY_DN93733_c0_g1_i1:30-1676(+)
MEKPAKTEAACLCGLPAPKRQRQASESPSPELPKAAHVRREGDRSSSKLLLPSEPSAASAAGRSVFVSLLQRARSGTGLASASHQSGARHTWYAPRLMVAQELENHEECVNCVSWSRDGEFLASGGDDTKLCIWSYGRRLSLQTALSTGHTANIFGVAFMTPELLVSCSMDGTVRLVDAVAGSLVSVWHAHQRAANKVVVDPQDANLALSCGGDGKVKQMDRRSKTSHVLLDWDLRWDGRSMGVSGPDINSMASSLLRPELLALGGDDAFIWLYDRRKLGQTFSCTSEPLAVFRPPDMPVAPGGSVTGVALSPDGRRLLGSWSRHHAFEFSTSAGCERPPLTALLGQRLPGPTEPRVARLGIPPSASRRHGWDEDRFVCSPRTEFKGHSNVVTIKEVAYLGAEAGLVASGSDCGRLFIWEASSGQLLCLRRGDAFVINAIASHPRDLCLATGGIDSSVKIWTPIAPPGLMPSRLGDVPWVKDIMAANRQNQTARSSALGFGEEWGVTGLGFGILNSDEEERFLEEDSISSSEMAFTQCEDDESSEVHE